MLSKKIIIFIGWIKVNGITQPYMGLNSFVKIMKLDQIDHEAINKFFK